MKVQKWVIKRPGYMRVFDTYKKCYETRFRRKLRSVRMINEVKEKLHALTDRVGTREAILAVETLFTSTRLKWVNGHHLFLSNRHNYDTYIVPAIAEVEDAKQKGEQAEWKGGSSTKSREMTAEEFERFGK